MVKNHKSEKRFVIILIMSVGTIPPGNIGDSKPDPRRPDPGLISFDVEKLGIKFPGETETLRQEFRTTNELAKHIDLNRLIEDGTVVDSRDNSTPNEQEMGRDLAYVTNIMRIWPRLDKTQKNRIANELATRTRYGDMFGLEFFGGYKDAFEIKESDNPLLSKLLSVSLLIQSMNQIEKNQVLDQDSRIELLNLFQKLIESNISMKDDEFQKNDDSFARLLEDLSLELLVSGDLEDKTRAKVQRLKEDFDTFGTKSMLSARIDEAFQLTQLKKATRSTTHSDLVVKLSDFVEQLTQKIDPNQNQARQEVWQNPLSQCFELAREANKEQLVLGVNTNEPLMTDKGTQTTLAKERYKLLKNAVEHGYKKLYIEMGVVEDVIVYLARHLGEEKLHIPGTGELMSYMRQNLNDFFDLKNKSTNLVDFLGVNPEHVNDKARIAFQYFIDLKQFQLSFEEDQRPGIRLRDDCSHSLIKFDDEGKLLTITSIEEDDTGPDREPDSNCFMIKHVDRVDHINYASFHENGEEIKTKSLFMTALPYAHTKLLPRIPNGSKSTASFIDDELVSLHADVKKELTGEETTLSNKPFRPGDDMRAWLKERMVNKPIFPEYIITTVNDNPDSDAEATYQDSGVSSPLQLA